MNIIFKVFPIKEHHAVHPDEISECLQVMNNEIISHIKKFDEKYKPILNRLPEQHNFKVNVRVISDLLASHISKSTDIEKKNLFISLYSYDDSEKKLRYELHQDPKKDLVKSKVIDIYNDEYREYECVKCIKSENFFAYVLDKKRYAKGKERRYSTFKQYIGCKIESPEILFGFLNIEFHKIEVFPNEDEIFDFMEKNISPFKQLFEYQFLKRNFFSKFNKTNQHWEVTQ